MLVFVPLVARNGQLVLVRCKGANIPSDVVAPTRGLYPVNRACAYPNYISRFLGESVNRNICALQISQKWPPRPMKIADIISEKENNHKQLIVSFNAS